MRPNPHTSRRRTPATAYSLLETALLVVGLSVLPLAMLVAAAMPAAAVGATVAVAGLAVGVSAARRLREDAATRRQVCVPGTEVCASV